MLKRVSILAAIAFSGSTVVAHAAPIVASGYALRLITASPVGDTGADSITSAGNAFYVGYGDHHLPDGSDGLSSTIVKYGLDGSILGSTTVVGHNDGLRYNAATGQIWALQNEDANPNLVLIDPATLAKSQAYSIPNPHGGGYDDVAFSGGKAYLTASNPNLDPTGTNSIGLPAVVSATIPTTGSTLLITPVLNGTDTATNVNTGGTTVLNITDPDGAITTPDGSIQFASQGDSTLITIQNPGAQNQKFSVLSASAQLDDIAYAASSGQTLLFTDATTNNLYALTGNFAPNTAFVAAAFPDGTANAGTEIGILDQTTGQITSLVSGVNPGGLEFVSASVPEPGTLSILFAGFAGLAAFGRRRRMGL